MARKTLLAPPKIALGAGVTEALHGAPYVAVSDVVNFNDSSPVAIFAVPANTLVIDIQCEILVAFNGTTPAIDVGVSGTAARHMAAADITEGTPGTYGNAALKPYKYSADTDIIATLTLTGASTGQARFYCLYRPLTNENPMAK